MSYFAAAALGLYLGLALILVLAGAEAAKIRNRSDSPVAQDDEPWIFDSPPEPERSEHEKLLDEAARRQRLTQELQAHPRLLEAQCDIWAQQDVECVIRAMSVHGFTACRSRISRHAGRGFHGMSVQRFTACRSSS